MSLKEQDTTPIPQDLQRLSRWLDSSITLPGGVRIGWDAIIGLVPFVGDLTGLIISLYIVAGSFRAGASFSTILRMLLNVGLEAVIGAVPLIGDVFDMFFKANIRNIQLLENQFADAAPVNKQNKKKFWIVALISLLAIAVAFYTVVTLVLYLVRLLF